MAKSGRDKIRMISSAGTGHFYTTDKNKKNTPDKMEMKKYDPVVQSTRLNSSPLATSYAVLRL